MVKMLADEYHGHKCAHSHSFSIWNSKIVELKENDALYMAGEINHAEWLLAIERINKEWA